MKGTALYRRELKRVDLDVLIRFLDALCEINSAGITNLQMKTGTNHSACIKYVQFLQRVGFVEVVVNGKNRSVSVTERGREALRLLSPSFAM